MEEKLAEREAVEEALHSLRGELEEEKMWKAQFLDEVREAERQAKDATTTMKNANEKTRIERKNFQLLEQKRQTLAKECEKLLEMKKDIETFLEVKTREDVLLLDETEEDEEEENFPVVDDERKRRRGGKGGRRGRRAERIRLCFNIFDARKRFGLHAILSRLAITSATSNEVLLYSKTRTRSVYAGWIHENVPTRNRAHREGGEIASQSKRRKRNSIRWKKKKEKKEKKRSTTQQHHNHHNKITSSLRG